MLGPEFATEDKSCQGEMAPAWGFFMLLVHSRATLQYYSQLPLLNKITTNVIAKSQKNDLLQVSPKYVDSLLILAPLAPLYMGSGAFH